MLGLANTISSGSAPESKYSLTLDGTDDFIDLGTGISLGTGDFTISAWVKTADFHSKFIISEYVDAENRWYVRGNDADPPRLQMYQEIGDTSHSTYTGSSISLDDHKNVWTHIVISADRDGKVVGYINGVADTADKNGEATSLTTTANTFIGRYSSTYSDFQMDNIAIFKTALSAFNVLLLLGHGSDDLRNSPAIDIKSNLIGYWRMGNGVFDDKVNGVVHDQAGNAGGDLVTGGGMGDASDWTAGTGWLVNDSSSGAAVHSNHGSGIYNYLSQDISAVNGKKYKVVWTISSYGGSGSLHIQIGSGGTAPSVSANGTYSHIVTCGSTDSSLYIGAAKTVDATIDNVSVFEVAPGYGVQMVTNGHFDTNTTGWTADSGASGSSITQGTFGGRDGVARFVINNASSSNRYKQDITWEEDALYYFSVDVYLLSGKFRIDGVDDTIIGAGPGSNANVLGTITYDAAVDDRWRTLTGYGIGVQTGGTDEIWIRSSGIAAEFYVDNVSVKKLNGYPGLTSGGPTFSGDTP